MPIYKNILLAVDLRVTHDAYTLEEAVNIAKDLNAMLYIIHVIEPLHSYSVKPVQMFVDLEKQLRQDARTAFSDLISNYDIEAENLILEIGTPKNVIVEQAKKLDVDLIMVGAHSRHGMSSLIGSTANGVINSAHCDVLAIRTTD